MPRTVTVTGSFAYPGGRPVVAPVRFTPLRGWIIEDGVAWATLAPETMTSHDGSFTVLVTPTDADSVPWHYRVDSPAGTFVITVPYAELGYTLLERINEHRSGSRT